MVSAVFKTVGCNLLQRQVRFLPLPHFPIAGENRILMEKTSILRNIPQVEKLLQSDPVREFIPVLGRGIVTNIIRAETESFRKRASAATGLTVDDLQSCIVAACARKSREKLQRVINGTGVIIHTNLGRSPLSRRILEKLSHTMNGYCNLEYFIPERTRGRRGGFAEELICDLTGAEDALIVNNNASSVFLILNHFAAGKEVIVSRGELIQIGGGFRIPDIMNQTGARLVEVGTTNITELADVSGAVTENTAMILSAHQSNYRIDGFAHRPGLAELATLKSGSILLVRDLGSGNLVNDQRLPRPFEPTITRELSQGADLVCFSGDKLLGAGQAGIIIGRKDLVQELRSHPLMRMIRVDKITYYLLQETLLEYENAATEDVALWQIILQDRKNSGSRINRVLRRIASPGLKKCITRVSTRATFGGGSMPGEEVESRGLSFDIPGISAEELYSFFIDEPVPVLGKIADDRFCLDFMTVLDRDIPVIVESINRLAPRLQEKP